MPPQERIEAAGGLAFEVDLDAGARVAWREPDWLGPVGLRVWRGAEAVEPRVAALGRFAGADDLGAFEALALDWEPAPLAIETSVRAYRERPVLVFRITAREALGGLATGSFDEPSIAWPWCRPERRAAGGLPEGARAFGHQYTEFGMPTQSDASLAGFFLLPFRPAVVEPLWLLAPDGRALLAAPLDAFHEQVLAVPRGPAAAASGVRCGWHGDLDAVPAGFATEWALWGGDGPRSALEAWGEFLRERHRTVRTGRYADSLGSHLSYWTDNGAAYWYRSEPGCGGVAGTLVAAGDRLRRARVPVRVFQLDSWFYPHEKLRPFDVDEASVPPTGLVTWDARPDVLPEGVPGLRRALGDPPLAAHCRHFSSASPYFAESGGFEAWRDGERAHPAGPELYERLLHQAAGWGVETFEHDWLVECFLGVRGLREAPGRARAWQEGVDRAAAAHGLTLQWCMASPADFFQTLTLRRVTSIRTSGDYRYVIGSGALWAWFLYGNALARALGLVPYKDVFLTRRDASGRDGDPHAAMEALLAALSTGPVGIGDRVGRTDRDLVLRTCRADGLLVRPDVPVAALERCFGGHAVLEPNALVGEAHTRHPAGRWSYLVSANVWRAERPLRFRVSLADLGPLRPTAPVLAWDWRARTARRLDPAEGDAGFDLELAPRSWDYRVLCPELPGGIAVVGDPALYATAGDRRVASVRSTPEGVEFDVLGSPGERVRVVGWAARRPAGARRWTPAAGSARLALDWEPSRADAGGLWSAELAIDAGGFARVAVEAA